jgi:hypothetical protein
MTTIVTGLFDISREGMDGRNWQSYLDWFSDTLKLNASFVVFVEPKLEHFVKEKRNERSTKIIVQELKDLEFYKYKDKMDSIISSSEYRSKIKDNSRIECNHSLYSIIQYSKFAWMKQAAQKNYFKDNYFIWMDAGLSRFFGPLDLTKRYPSVNAENNLISDKEKILIQTFMSFYPDLFYAGELSEGYLLDNRSYVMGGMFGGDKKAIYKIKKEIIDLFEMMLDNNIVNNEQIALGYLYKKYPQLFKPFINNAAIHRSYEMINMLSL